MTIHRLRCGSANCYAVKTTTGAILFDTGHPGDMEKIETALRAVGIEPEELVLILLTHGHMDHAGSAKALKEKHNIPVAMHPGDLDMGTLRSIGLIGRVILFFSQKLLRQTIDFEPDIALRDGLDLSGYGLPARVVALPGHSKGSVGFLFDDGSLICGDMYMDFIGPSRAHLYEDREILRLSHKKLKGLPVGTVYPGHGDSFQFTQLNLASADGDAG